MQLFEYQMTEIVACTAAIIFLLWLSIYVQTTRTYLFLKNVHTELANSYYNNNRFSSLVLIIESIKKFMVKCFKCLHHINKYLF
jgi:hypothetical protein